MRSLGDERVRDLVARFVAAFEAGDVERILALLAEDASFAMPPYASWCRGRDAIADSWLMPSGPAPRLRYVSTRANGQLGLGTYVLAPERDGYVSLALDVLALDSEARITAVTAFRSPQVFRDFGLPDRLPL